MHIESLESRRLFSVTVTEGYPGFYEVWGDDSANVIDISVSMQNETFTLNGVTYSNVAYIWVYGFGGDDVITVTSVDGWGYIGASISGHDGNDQISLNFDGGIWGGEGDDVLYMSDSFHGEAYGGGGNDQMYISGDCYGAEIRGGDGNDLIDCSGNNCPVTVRGGAGDDTLIGSNYNDVLYGDQGSDRLIGGGGNDYFYSDEDDEVFQDWP